MSSRLLVLPEEIELFLHGAYQNNSQARSTCWMPRSRAPQCLPHPLKNILGGLVCGSFHVWAPGGTSPTPRLPGLHGPNHRFYPRVSPGKMAIKYYRGFIDYFSPFDLHRSHRQFSGTRQMSLYNTRFTIPMTRTPTFSLPKEAADSSSPGLLATHPTRR
jgi:hypothetical protein